MTREEAKRNISNALRWGDKADPEVLRMAIKALEQQSCEGCISRQAAIIALDDRMSSLDNVDMQIAMGFAKGIIYDLPPVTPQPKTGHWSRKTKVDAYDIAGVKTWGIKCQCDRCDFTTIVVEDFGYYKFCPNCGAKMESEDKE